MYTAVFQAFLLYEEAVCDQRARITALHSIVGTLYSCHCFGQENWEALVQVCSRVAACVWLLVFLVCLCVRVRELISGFLQ
jgi:hypothetical protein